MMHLRLMSAVGIAHRGDPVVGAIMMFGGGCRSRVSVALAASGAASEIIKASPRMLLA